MSAWPLRPDDDDPPTRIGPWMEYDPPPPHQPCPACTAHYAAELTRWQRTAFALADAEAMNRENRERLIADLAASSQANESLRRTIDRLRHYDTEGD